MRFLISVLLTLWGVQVLAQDLKIKGKSEVSPGRQVVLEIGHIPGETWMWTLANPPADGDDGPNVPYITEDGKTAVFATTVNGYYYFVASVGSVGEADKKVVVKQLLHVLKVGQPDDPQPGPTPKPLKPLPEGKYGLATFVRDQAVTAKVPKEIAKVAALAYRSAAGKIQDKSIIDPTKAYEVVVDQINDSLVDEQLDQLDKVTAPLVKKLDQFAKEGKLKSVDDQMIAFNEVALGLENVP